MQTRKAHMAKIGRLILSALFFAGFLTGCNREPVYEFSAGETQSVTEAAAQSGQEEEETAPLEQYYVYVCGAVAFPGVYALPAGTRVYEAVREAGGFAENADQEWLNLAEPVTDGQKLWVYTTQETRLLREAGQTPSLAGTSQTERNAKVNLNTADRELLMTLPGIGEAKAEAILQYRAENGKFTAIEEIMEISGIKEAVFSKIKDQITV